MNPWQHPAQRGKDRMRSRRKRAKEEVQPPHLTKAAAPKTAEVKKCKAFRKVTHDLQL